MPFHIVQDTGVDSFGLGGLELAPSESKSFRARLVVDEFIVSGGVIVDVRTCLRQKRWFV